MEIRAEFYEYTPDLLEVARAYYSDLPYHNFGHALYVLENTRQFVTECEQNGLAVNEKVVVAAALFHDAGFEIPIEEHGYRSKEEFSAVTASMILGDYGYSDEEIEHVAACIRSTERGVPCQSLEAKIVRRADLSNLTGDLETMLEHSRDLWHESWLLNPKNTPLNFDDFIKSIRKGLQPYFDEDTTFGDFDTVEGTPRFNLDVAKNLDKIKILDLAQAAGLITESWYALCQKPGEVLENLVNRFKTIVKE